MKMNTPKNNQWLYIFTLLLLTANIVTLAFLWIHKSDDRHEKPPPPPNGPAFEFIATELKLDSLQVAAYQKLREAHQAEIRPILDSVRKAKDHLFSFLKQAAVADSELAAAAKITGALEQQRDMLTFRHFQKLRLLCKPEQQQKFDAIIEEVLKRMAQQKRPGPPHGREGDRPERMHPPHDGKELGDRHPPD